MKTKNLLTLIAVLCFFSSFGQETKTRVGYYSGNRLAVSLFTHCKFYPQLQIESKDLEFDKAQYALVLKNDVPFEELNFSWGAGFSYTNDKERDNYLVIPLELRKDNILIDHLSLTIGLEVKSNFSSDSRINPLIGLAFAF